MRIERVETEWIFLSDMEVFAFKRVGDILAKVYSQHNENTDLVSTSTGEVISISELARVMGILGFFEENNILCEVKKIEKRVDN